VVDQRDEGVWVVAAYLATSVEVTAEERDDGLQLVPSTWT
jgi:hypothetical protein